MAIKSLVNDAWEDITDIKTEVNGAFESVDHANAYVNGAWEEVWSSTRYRCIGKVFGGDDDSTAKYTPNGTSAYIMLQYSDRGIYLRIPSVTLSKGDSCTIECTLDSAITSTIKIGKYYSPTGYYTMYTEVTPVAGKNIWTINAEAWYQQLVIKIENEISYSLNEFNISNLRINGVLCEFE